MTFPSIGDRVVVRYHIDDGATDVIGLLESADADIVVIAPASGDRVIIPTHRIVAAKAVPPRPIRTSELRGLESAAADGWPGVEQEFVDGWLLRSGHGFTRRANCALPLEPHARADAASIAAIERWFADRSLTPVLSLPDRLVSVPPGWELEADVHVLAADIGNLTLPTAAPVATVTAEPDDAWVGRYHYRGGAVPPLGRDVITAVRGGITGFVRIGDAGHTLAIARGAVTTAPDGRTWVGMSAVEVAPEHRRRGLGTLICGETVRWGRACGATHAYLQVESANAGAAALYRGMGFVDHHAYRYATRSA